MTNRRLTFELPEQLVAQLGSPEEVATKAKQALVLQLLREGRIGQSRAAELLSITRWDLLELMSEYEAPSGLASADDVQQELDTVRRLRRNDGAA